MAILVGSPFFPSFLVRDEFLVTKPGGATPGTGMELALDKHCFQVILAPVAMLPVQ